MAGCGESSKSGKSGNDVKLDRACLEPVVRSPQPCVGPGQDITRKKLRSRWQSMCPRQDIIDFYGHKWHKVGELAVFSNFFEQGSWPGAFDFQVPLAFCACDISEQERVVSCDFSEKAIMLCKAAACGDISTYRLIAKAERPALDPDLSILELSRSSWQRMCLLWNQSLRFLRTLLWRRVRWHGRARGAFFVRPRCSRPFRATCSRRTSGGHDRMRR